MIIESEKKRASQNYKDLKESRLIEDKVMGDNWHKPFGWSPRTELKWWPDIFKKMESDWVLIGEYLSNLLHLTGYNVYSDTTKLWRVNTASAENKYKALIKTLEALNVEKS